MGDIGPIVPPLVTQSAEDSAGASSISEDVTVLVTGFGPFRNSPLNSSYLIASILPATIPFPTPGGANPTPNESSTPTSPLSPPRKIRIYTHPAPIRVSYSTVRTAIPALLASYAENHNGKRPDIIMHIGMASARHYYTVETLAHRDGYRMADVDGRIGFEDGEKRWKEQALPAILRPGPAVNNDNSDNSTPLPTDPTTLATIAGTTTEEYRAEETDPSFSTTKLPSPLSQTPLPAAIPTTITPYPPDRTCLAHWKSFSPPTADVRLSEDAGRYLCEFIYYTSLAQAFQEGQNQSTVFFHVPGWTDDASLEKGRDVAIALVQALVACWVDT